MPEWWTYTLSDIQSFSLETWYQTIERYNEAIWPAQIVALALAGAIVLLLRRAERRRGRIVSAILAAFWVWIAIAFHATRYRTLTWLAVYFAGAFALQALLLLWTGVVRGRLMFDRRAGVTGRTGLSLFLFAVLVQPLIGLLSGREWRQVEIFGIAPDPTAAGTLGLLLLAGGRVRWVLLAAPVLGLAYSAAILASMDAPDAWIPAAEAILVVSIGVFGSLRNRGQTTVSG